jgi:iron-sulfur cluster repair protein YtfE (RIC family)
MRSIAVIQIGAPPATIDTPIEHLMACHRRIEQRLDGLFNAAGYLKTDRPAALEAIRNSLRFMDTSGALHTEDEEASLFPRLRPKLSSDEIAFLNSLETQHVEAGAIYSELKRLAQDLASEPGTESVRRYRECAERLRSLYRDHIRAEDEILTAIARRSLDAGEIGAISREMRARRG